jgi:hypothetical protein
LLPAWSYGRWGKVLGGNAPILKNCREKYNKERKGEVSQEIIWRAKGSIYGQAVPFSNPGG